MLNFLVTSFLILCVTVHVCKTATDNITRLLFWYVVLVLLVVAMWLEPVGLIVDFLTWSK